MEGNKMDAKVINTRALLALAAWADRTDQNRQVDVDRLTRDVDPEGVHLIRRVLLFHNGEPVDRVSVFAKVTGEATPARFMLDIPHDLYEAFAAADGLALTE